MSFFRNAAGLLLTSSVNVTLGFLLSIVLARYLSPEDRGLYSVAMAFAGLAAALTRIGWPSASIYRLRRMQSDPARVAGIGILAMVVVSVLTVAGSFLFEPTVTHRFLDDAPSRIYYLAIAFIPFQLLTFLFFAIARGIDRFAIQNWSTFSFTLGSLVAASAILLGDLGGLIELLSALLALRIAVTTGLMIAVLRHTGASLRPDRDEIVDGFKFGIKSHFQGLAGMLHERVDVFMIAFFLQDPAQVAYYAIAVGVIERVKMAPRALSAATFPQVAGLPEREASRFVCSVSRQSVVLVLGSIAVLGAVGPFVIPFLYGEAYQASIAPFALLMPAMGMLTIYQILGRFFAGMNRQQVNIWTQCLSVAVNVGLNLYLIPRYGILGAACASLVSYSVEAALISVFFLRTTGRSFSELFVFRREDLDAYRKRLGPVLKRLGVAR